MAFGGLEAACQCVATTYASAAALVGVIGSKIAYRSETPSGRLDEVAASTEKTAVHGAMIYRLEQVALRCQGAWWRKWSGSRVRVGVKNRKAGKQEKSEDGYF